MTASEAESMSVAAGHPDCGTQRGCSGVDAFSPGDFCPRDCGEWMTSVGGGQLSWQAFPALCSARIGKLVCKDKQMEKPNPEP